jgi:hypothetical protein
MNHKQGTRKSDVSIYRRSILATLGVAATAGLLRLVQGGGLAYALTKEERDKITTDEIIVRGKKAMNGSAQASARIGICYVSRRTPSRASILRPSCLVASIHERQLS